jgi:hypothetical protein
MEKKKRFCGGELGDWLIEEEGERFGDGREEVRVVKLM